MENLRYDFYASRSRLAYWEDAAERSGGSWGESMAIMNSSSDIDTIQEIMRVLEQYAVQKMLKK
jgi:hypothetical protein